MPHTLGPAIKEKIFGLEKYDATHEIIKVYLVQFLS